MSFQKTVPRLCRAISYDGNVTSSFDFLKPSVLKCSGVTLNIYSLTSSDSLDILNVGVLPSRSAIEIVHQQTQSYETVPEASDCPDLRYRPVLQTTLLSCRRDLSCDSGLQGMRVSEDHDLLSKWGILSKKRKQLFPLCSVGHFRFFNVLILRLCFGHGSQ